MERMGNENIRNLNWKDNNLVERRENKSSLGRAEEWHHDMMKIMQMQQQEIQQMQMNFVQAQQQQSQLLMHC